MKRPRTGWEPFYVKKRSTQVAKFQGTKLFITFPQNDIDKEDLVERILLQYPNKVEWIVACNEDHEKRDGDEYMGVHAHLIMKFKKKEWVYHDVWDHIGGKHGDYQCMKGTMLKACRYIMKDGNYISWGIKDLEKYVSKLEKKQNPKSELVIEQFNEGKSLRDVAKDPELASFVMMNMQKLEYYYSVRQIWDSEPERIYTLYDNISEEINANSRDLFDFLEVNLTYKRKHKQKQGWILGPTDVGKTQLKEQLMRRYKCFISGGQDMLKGYENNYYDIIIIDEPSKGQYRCEMLNRLLEGSKFPIEQRYSDAYKLDNPLVLILTNYTPEEFYPKISAWPGTDTFKAFLNRIEIFEFIKEEPIRIWSDIY